MAPRDTQRHVKIAEYLRGLISSGELNQGDVIPSEAELCEQFSASRGPVRQAIATLRSEGLVSSGRGRRSIVLGRFVAETFEHIISNTHWLRDRGYEAEQKTLWMARRPAPKGVAEFLQLEEDSPVIFLHRVRSANGEPVIVERLYFPLEIGRPLLELDSSSGSDSVHDFLDARGVNFDSAHRQLSFVLASEEDARSLGVSEGTPLWRVRMEISDPSGRPIELADNLYRADNLVLGMTTVRGSTSPLEIMFAKPE
ncbi:GntR family transcriptional regulator [Corynebacterium sp.]|uniref:GntR family transcriptional regulator n=1 Tax=Corynebacterium sp. TaxID=1720 RepID=UPI0026DB2E1F|nr:GntR family transcriptional regulator [Corynebacterium sp.]MDO5031059.1 GntR family transcriptional regulator [Corynebacterium sp.]